ncbi:MAG: hypothetical protein M1828_004839 [Chrysothrix sp. TS-e1954]|nr:MAG: hypothetical protein M1828_004839 [Chrysothrix sp. TS-e1954]
MSSNQARNTSWLSEIDKAERRRVSAPVGHLVPYDLNLVSSASHARPVVAAASTANRPFAPVASNAYATGPASEASLAHQLGPTLARFNLGPDTEDDLATSNAERPSSNASNVGPKVNSRLQPILEPTARSDTQISDYEQMVSENSLYIVVSMKAYRSDVYVRVPGIQFCHPFRPGNTLVVDGDRGYDLGVVQFLTYNRGSAEKYAEELNRRHMQDLLKYSRNYRLIENPPGIHVGGDRFEGNHRACRHAKDEEVNWLRDKEHLEMKLTRAVQKTANEMGIPMEVLDVDIQADLSKVIVYYFSDVYVHFTELNSALNKRSGGRIWMCNVVTNASPSGTGTHATPQDLRRPRPMQTQPPQAIATPPPQYPPLSTTMAQMQLGPPSPHHRGQGYPAHRSTYPPPPSTQQQVFGSPLSTGTSSTGGVPLQGYGETKFPSKSRATPRPLPPGVPPLSPSPERRR